jgi:hypothetical protein
MRCNEPAEMCLGDHIAQHLEQARQVRHGQWSALCPAHGDSNASLSIGVGHPRRIVWQCQAGCNWIDVRTAMIRRGVPDGCLPCGREQRTEDELIALLLPIVKEGPSTLTHLRIAAIAKGLGALPRGGTELAELAAMANVPRSTAYRAVERALGGAQPHNNVDSSSVTQRQNAAANPQVDGVRYGTTGVPQWDTVSQSGTGSVAFRNADQGESVMERPDLGLTVTPPQRCQVCERPLPFAATSRRHYCSTACRQKAWRAQRGASR